MPPSPTLTARVRAELAKTKAFRSVSKRVEDGRVDVTGAAVEARALCLAALQEATKKRIAVVVPGDAAIDDFEASLRLFHHDARCVSAYPSPSLSPYQDLSPSLGVVRNEIRALGMLIDRSVEVLIVPARALFSRLPPAGGVCVADRSHGGRCRAEILRMCPQDLTDCP
jgi:transcription-repair coupling factor (superfamily II helicase)